MPRRKNSTPDLADRPAFTYSPGDRHTYTWDGSTEYATVWRHQLATDGTITMAPTGERVPMTGAARTATAFSDAVDRWRAP